MNFLVMHRKRGEPVQAPELFERAWDEFIELQVMDKSAWLQHTLSTLSCLDRFEIGVHNGQSIIGGVILARDNDIHIGDCLSVFGQYVLPEFRHTGVSRRCMVECFSLAKDLGHTHIAYTHRAGDWRYETIYRKVK